MPSVKTKNISVISAVILISLTVCGKTGAETSLRLNLELYNSVFQTDKHTWHYSGSGMADIRFASSGNRNVKAEAALEFYPLDINGLPQTETVPAFSLKRLWFKANFPSWRLTMGKTKVAWGNGTVFNSGDILFGSLSPFLDFTQSAIRDDTAFLTAFNIPTGRFSYAEGVVLPPSFVYDSADGLTLQKTDRTSGGLRYFARAGGWKLEGGYLYKGDSKTAFDLLGHKPYFSFHGHAGIDIYGAASLAAGRDPLISGSDQNRNTWKEISKTVNISLGGFHQLQTGYDSTLMLRLEALVMPWQNWESVSGLTAGSGYYGITIYPEITWMLRSSIYFSVQSVISPVDASAQLTTTAGWNVSQGFTLLGFVVVNAGENQDLFPSEGRTNITLGARYSY